MRILLWHGYLLSGSGSNVYTSNIAREWRAAGHDVVVMCQDRNADRLPFVDEVREISGRPESFPSRPGSCRVTVPFIGSLLPVYVYDAYEGFEVKRFVELTDSELERYTALNRDAMAGVIDAFRPEVIVTGHEVMGPYIAREACRPTSAPYAAKLHGSALEYAVKVQDRYLTYASDGLGAAVCVIGGSRYMVREAASVVPGWEDRAVVVNPGCDVTLFRPSSLPRGEPPTVAFVGKLIASKGVHNFLAALGLVEKPFRVVIVGYGGFDSALRDLADALKRGDINAAVEIARRGEVGPLEDLLSFLSGGEIDRSYLQRFAQLDVTFAGRLEHGPLSEVLPTFDVLVVPSVLPEAFGMVAAEAAACGVLPVVPDHSGIAEAGAAVEEAVGVPGLLTFDSRAPILSMAAAIDRVLRLSPADREEMGKAAVALARQRWSWAHVAGNLLSHAAG